MTDDKPGAEDDATEVELEETDLAEAADTEVDGEPADEPDEAEAEFEDEAEDDEAEADRPRFEVPPLPPLLILALVGLLAGFVAVALVWVSERGCDQLRGSPNCGSAGFPLLVLAVVITVVFGAIALKRLAMPNHKLVAFLGVGFMLLIVLGFLSNDLFSTWTLVIVPVLTAVTFLVAHLIAGRLERADA
ncbi:hypothetical protein AB0P21_29685 [Kribbella sp. NPDC056861]|uniref:hypothetical protein n=1 Tax=Kribbella sp. NPDC056861 TaxID=3154857 RepID=UPI0034146F07